MTIETINISHTPVDLSALLARIQQTQEGVVLLTDDGMSAALTPTLASPNSQAPSTQNVAGLVDTMLGLRDTMNLTKPAGMTLKDMINDGRM